MTIEEAYDLGKKAGEAELIEKIIEALKIDDRIKSAIKHHEETRHDD